jgi:hypothetical protein
VDGLASKIRAQIGVLNERIKAKQEERRWWAAQYVAYMVGPQNVGSKEREIDLLTQ